MYVSVCVCVSVAMQIFHRNIYFSWDIEMLRVDFIRFS